MKIEVVDFYQHSYDAADDVLLGTLHIYLVDFDIDLRGIRMKRKQGVWTIKFYTVSGYDKETKAQVWYPLFIFADKKKNQALIDEIRKLAIPFIEKNLKIKAKKTV